MSRHLSLAIVAALLLIVSACSGGTAASPAPASQPPASEAPASESPAASESGVATEACAPSADTGTVTATIANFAFSPATITAKVGDVVTWTNNDSAAHTATVESDATCTTENLGSGASGGIVFNTAGSYDYFCKIHPNMTGKVEVS
ncbi:MAG TPA: cupredoxin domain-containing protein [Candidatus Limnocylindrales bacterium]|nr:cupredoxin domain-containing protein [Candidatus Limnocylindrales bacterium]